MVGKIVGAFLTATFAAMLLAAAFATGAYAAPAWKFNGTELTGTETIVGDATLSDLTVPSLTTTCKKMHYEMTIFNSVGTGKAELTALSFKTCFTSNPECTVKTVGAEKLPWAGHLATVSSNPYVVLEGVKIGIVYGGIACPLGGVLVAVTGSAGALYDNVSETFSFDSASFAATKTSLKALATAIQWNGVFTTEATGPHNGEALTIS